MVWFNDLVQTLSQLSDLLPRLGLIGHVSWSIWKCQNDFIFSGISCHRRALFHAFSVNDVIFLVATYSGLS